MQPHKQTVPTASLASLLTAILAVSPAVTLAMSLGCSRPLPSEESADDNMPDVPADLPPEPTEYAGILKGLNFGTAPSRFALCDTGEVVEWSLPGSRQAEVWSGSCYGVYHRVRGQLDRDFEPPRLIIDEIVESRWCEPGDCTEDCVPQFDSCYDEHDVFGGCDPLLSDCGDGRCIAERFYATETAGWMFFVCRDADKASVAGDPCKYTDSLKGEIDDCADGYRCWNPEGDISQPGTCVPYCDVEGELGPACNDTCVPCSATARGLCLSECSGDDCRVDEFC